MQNLSPKPVAFDIQLKKSPERSLPIKTKLEASVNEFAAPTLEDIEKKLLKAENLRKEQELKNFKPIEEKISKVLEKKQSLNKEEMTKIQKTIELKFETAEQLRQRELDQIKDKARIQIVRVEKAQQTREELEKEQESKL